MVSDRILYDKNIWLVCETKSSEKYLKERESTGKNGKCVGERQKSRGLAVLTLTDYSLTFGVRTSEMSDGL